MKLNTYLAGSLLFFTGSYISFLTATTGWQLVIAVIYLLGSIMFILGTLSQVKGDA